MKLALEAGGDVHFANGFGMNHLHIASTAGPVEIVEALLKAGALVNRADGQGWTPLIYASSSGLEKTVASLLAAKASVNLATKVGRLFLLWHISHLDMMMDSHGRTAGRLSSAQRFGVITRWLSSSLLQEQRWMWSGRASRFWSW